MAARRLRAAAGDGDRMIRVQEARFDVGAAYSGRPSPPTAETVAPVTTDGTGGTEFILVPYVGACIHVPPPPANQIVIASGLWSRP